MYLYTLYLVVRTHRNCQLFWQVRRMKLHTLHDTVVVRHMVEPCIFNWDTWSLDQKWPAISVGNPLSDAVSKAQRLTHEVQELRSSAKHLKTDKSSVYISVWGITPGKTIRYIDINNYMHVSCILWLFLLSWNDWLWVVLAYKSACHGVTMVWSSLSCKDKHGMDGFSWYFRTHLVHDACRFVALHTYAMWDIHVYNIASIIPSHQSNFSMYASIISNDSTIIYSGA